MNIQTGDYVIEFLNHKGETMPGTQMIATINGEAVEKAKAGLKMFGAQKYRIMRCMMVSDDRQKERWECD